MCTVFYWKNKKGRNIECKKAEYLRDSLLMLECSKQHEIGETFLTLQDQGKILFV